MPLSKARNRERMRLLRSVQPKPMLPEPSRAIPDWVVQPNVYLQPMAVQPKSMVVQPNVYLQAHMKYCLDYDPVQPEFDHCPYINPLQRFPFIPIHTIAETQMG